MTDPVKKTTKKAATTATKTKTPTRASTKKSAATNGRNSNVTEIGISHEQIAKLAHRYWAERGGQDGHHEEDWFRAEQALRGKAS